MNELTTIQLKCTICEDTHRYQYTKEQVLGLEPLWLAQNGNTNEPLDQLPIVGDIYQVQLVGPLTLDPTQPFWAVYLTPFAYANGIETANCLTNLRFCLCNTIAVKAIQPQHALLTVSVLDVLPMHKPPQAKNPDFKWFTLLDSSDTYQRSGTTLHFEKYALIDINVQSDLGITAIARYDADGWYFVAVNEWDFHYNSWGLCHIKVTEAQCLRFALSAKPA